MTDLDALRAAIFANVDDDTVRLIYADALEESGDEFMAEFIRVQVAVAAISGTPEVPHPLDDMRELEKKRLLQRRMRDMVANQDHRKWFPELGDEWIVNCSDYLQAGLDRPVAVILRGFIDSVICTAADWTRAADAILARHPVRKVRLTTRPEWALEDYGMEISRFQIAGKQIAMLNGCRTAALVAARWPQVKEWELPPENRYESLYMSRVDDPNNFDYAPTLPTE